MQVLEENLLYHVFYIFIALILTGCADKSRMTNTISATTPYDSIILANGYDVLPLFKTRTGHITVTLRVNGKPCVFLVDTGGGATLIDISKKEKYQLTPQVIRDYAAGIGSTSPLVRTSAVLRIDKNEFKTDSLFLMDISYLNAEFKKNRSQMVDGIIGSDFLDRYNAIIDYPNLRLYLNYTDRKSRGYNAENR